MSPTPGYFLPILETATAILRRAGPRLPAWDNLRCVFEAGLDGGECVIVATREVIWRGNAFDVARVFCLAVGGDAALHATLATEGRMSPAPKPALRAPGWITPDISLTDRPRKANSVRAEPARPTRRRGPIDGFSE
jgi:hypothetical protein